MSKDKHTVLKKVFGYSSFRPGQEEVIDHLLSGHDGLVIMPTGGGKSICYQVPALVREGMAIVVSPLIALMEDQVVALKQMGVAAEALHSNQNSDELRRIVNDIDENKVKILYVSPERLASGRFVNYLKNKKVSFIAVDEAHCVSVWGNDFRPDYAALSMLKEHFPEKNIIALTATADKATQDDIIKQLQLKASKTFLSSFERENILINVKPGVDRKKAIINFVKRHRGESGIVYCLSRKNCEKVSDFLNDVGIKAGFYHAGMDANNRKIIQQDFQEDKLQVVCATIAFGMGIDKSNIKWVLHYNMPKNLESYYQEIGRAGRDGTQAVTVMYYSWNDFLTYKGFIDNSDGNQDFKFVQSAKLERMWEYVSTSDCRTNLILNYFGEYRSKGCEHCDNCLRPPTKFDGKVIVQKAISAVVRSKETLALNLLVDVLRGSQKQEVIAGGYQNLKTFGAGRDMPIAMWKDYVTQMIDKGMLRIDYTDRLRLKTTPLSRPAIMSDDSIMLKAFEYNENVGSSTVKKTRIKKKSGKEMVEEELVDELKSWRLKTAHELGVPAYVVLTDKSINGIASEKPTNIFDLEEVEGIGQKRIENYGTELLEVIQDYLRKQEHVKNLKGKTYLVTLYLYNQGKSATDIAALRGVNIVTIYSHFAHLFMQGEAINIKDYVSEEDLKAVHKAYIALDKSEVVNKINEYLNGQVEFSKLRMALAYVKRILENE